MSFVTELWAFLRQRKKFWLLPIIAMMMLVGLLLIFAQGSVLAPLVYTMF
jgi:paraquat-inducible protein B